MRVSCMRRLTAMVAATTLTCLTWLASAATPVPTAAITYVEYPEDGPMNSTGRNFTTDGHARYGVDINSVININVDRSTLLSTFAGSEVIKRANDLTNRLRSLEQFLGGLEQQANDLKNLAPLWKSNPALFKSRLNASANARFALFKFLADTREHRLSEKGVAVAAAAPEMQKLYDAVAAPQGHDWKTIESVLREELAAASDDLQNVGSQLRTGIRITAYLMPKNGSAVPVYLPGYNEAPSGPETPFTKLQFAASAEEQALYQKYEDMAKKQREAKNAGEALRGLLIAQFEEVRKQLQPVATAARQAVDRLSASEQRLQQWGSTERRRQWLQTVRQDLESSTGGPEVLAHWADLDTILDEIAIDVRALRAFADLKDALTGKAAPEAMSILLGRLDVLRTSPTQTVRLFDAGLWSTRMVKINQFVQAVGNLAPAMKARLAGADGPVGDITAARQAFTDFIETLGDQAANVANWLQLVLDSEPARVAADLPEPPGSRRRAVIEPGDLGTRINLLSIPTRREPGDVVQIRYVFDQGGTVVPGWSDEFVLQSFGWNSEVLASLAFARQAGQPTWKPTAAMNWMIWHTGWPGGSDKGLGRSPLKLLSGVGVSVMPLNSADTEGVQLGLGATLGFINNRVLIGIGTNLNASHDRGFIFMSIRLVEFPSLSGSLGGASAK